jgi:hypothetical protein
VTARRRERRDAVLRNGFGCDIDLVIGAGLQHTSLHTNGTRRLPDQFNGSQLPSHQSMIGARAYSLRMTWAQPPR